MTQTKEGLHPSVPFLSRTSAPPRPPPSSPRRLFACTPTIPPPPRQVNAPTPSTVTPYPLRVMGRWGGGERGLFSTPATRPTDPYPPLSPSPPPLLHSIVHKRRLKGDSRGGFTSIVRSSLEENGRERGRGRKEGLEWKLKMEALPW